ncbi:MAG: S-methyl-5-thioribose-1-phosphate isomerase [Microbacterium sp.]
MTGLPPSIAWTGEAVRIIDQRLIPDELRVRELGTVDEVIDAIATLAIRGANVIGSAGALGLALGIRAGLDARHTADRIIGARPTAVNLRTAVETALAAADPLEAALALIDADAEQCRLIGEHGRTELPGARTILTHCNTGRLATTGWGTALGVVYAKQAAGESVRVIATETRPLRQGARLTAWELAQSGIEVELIADSAAAAALAVRGVDAVIVGADRIAANGDTANKIGTRALARAARAEGVPFYVAATLNAVDLDTPDGAAIPIEERDGDELRGSGPGAVPAGIRVWNPAFDVAPAEAITGVITEAGVLRAPFGPALATALASARGAGRLLVSGGRR